MENKVAKKAIETIDLSQLIQLNNIKGFDIKPFLFKELVLQEKDFRAQLKSFDFSIYQGQSIFVYCSSNAIVPMWGYMLLASYLRDNKINFIFAPDLETAYNQFLLQKVLDMDVSIYQNKRVVIKGCGNKLKISPMVYMAATGKLKEVVKALSYGEACSMVPLFKN